MTPPNWDHVDHAITREVLTQQSIDEDSICQALTFANKCFVDDAHNPDIMPKIYHQRGLAVKEASECWNELGDLEGTIEALRRFWSI